MDQQVQNWLAELDDYYDEVGELYDAARRKEKQYRRMLTYLSASATIIDVAGLALIAAGVSAKWLSITMTVASLGLAIIILMIAQNRMSEADANKALEYLQVREESSRLVGESRVEWALIQGRSPYKEEEILEFSRRLLLAKQKIAERAHLVGIKPRDATV